MTRSQRGFSKKEKGLTESSMSKHHHHPHEGHGAGEPARRPLHHTWFFWVAGFFILLALISFVLSGNLAWRPSATPPPTAASTGGSGR